MTVIPYLSRQLGRNDEQPNIELAQKIVQTNNLKAVEELIDHLDSKIKFVPEDSIKTLYEIAREKPHWLTPYIEDLIELLHSKRNRLVWGSMIALHEITPTVSDEIIKHLAVIISAMDRGSVITKDHGVAILIELAKISDDLYQTCFPILLEYVGNAPINQFPTYAIKTVDIAKKEDYMLIRPILTERLEETEAYPAKQKKIIRLLKKLG